MDMDTLRILEEKSKFLRSEKSKLVEDMLLFCRLSNDPVAQDFNHRLDVIETAWETLSVDPNELQRKYDESREKQREWKKTSFYI